MEKFGARNASSYATTGRRVTRSMTRSAGKLQGTILDRNKQVIRKKSKTMRQNQMPFLPEEIIFKIFLLLPAKVLQEVMRPVCRSWRKVIHDPVFTKEHRSRSACNSPYGILKSLDYFEIYSMNKDETTWNLTARINQIFVTYGVGLILTFDGSLIYLLNPITKQVITLPHSPVQHYSSYNWAVGYTRSTSKYRVVCTNYYSGRASGRAYILTIGVDKQWREIVDSMPAGIPSYPLFCPLEVWGFMYWYQPWSQKLILFYLEKEIFYKVDFYEKCKGRWVTTAATENPSDRFLTIGLELDYRSRQWDFWELVDFKNGGEWRKSESIDLKDKMSEINEIMGFFSDVELKEGIWPMLVMKDEVIYKHDDCNSFFAYNFKKGTISRSFDNIPKGLKIMFANSLVEL